MAFTLSHNMGPSNGAFRSLSRQSLGSCLLSVFWPFPKALGGWSSITKKKKKLLRFSVDYIKDLSATKIC